ncbi:hypothetical protein BDN72DRAFT_959340 [Pluteus cervinus]|uniref:Uncharacterized protein n=1 Tax=Pluteus cervinus TaxID=181527 RepID=A0ACD3AVG7_9AGAR|nr:hypothetical protein BDN72DRAFT_959340 [Pluteus cervinus]
MPSDSAQSPSPNLHVDARRKIDEEIAELEARLVSLRRARNALAPIIRVHPEILQEVFSLVQLSNADNKQGKPALLVTWICHTWREIAHQTSALWSHIDFENPEWIEAALFRTKNRELEFNLLCVSRMGQYDAAFLVPLCLGNLYRIKALGIVSRDGRYTGAFPEHCPEWTMPAPRLTKLDLNGVALPPTLFSGTCPSLQSLNLSSCGVFWDALPLFPRLRELSIVHPHSEIPIDLMVEILEHTTPHLEELRMKYALDQPASSQIVERVGVSKLKALEIHESHQDLVIAFLNRVSLPLRINTRIVVMEWKDSTLAQALTSSRNLSKWEIEWLKISVDDRSTTLHITEGGSASRNTNAKSTDEGYAQNMPAATAEHSQTVFRIGGNYEDQDMKILDYFGGSGTAIRRFSFDPPFLESFLASTVRQIAKIHATHDGGGGADTDPLDQGNSAVARRALSFLDLRVLELHGDIQEGYYIVREDVETLRKWLVWRNRVGLKLERLIISGMVGPPLGWLREVFDELVGEFEISDMQVNEVDEVSN